MELQTPITRTISYAYDPLRRLTGADYSSGEEFAYSYDPVGNRLSQTALGVTITYTYDNANRLASVDGISYTWDDNGNLLSDGVFGYSYDSANRLTGVTDGQATTSYAYNGLGDRARQIENGVTTGYALDIAAGLTQVLAGGGQTYLYGLGRTAQEEAAGGGYFLTDALGSVRQMVDENGEITLVKNYQPYGSELSHLGSSDTAYGFTGEWTSSLTDLIYLRARWYSPQTGRFTQRDPSRLEANLFSYTASNPVNRTDPAGLFSSDQIARNMGYSSFDAMTHSLATMVSLPLLENSAYTKWGFFSALLDAKDGDNLETGTLILSTLYPHVEYRTTERLWLDCDQIMVGNQRLLDYFDYVLAQPTYRELPAEYWRDTSPHYYILSGENTNNRRYVDGIDTSDLPDFHSFDLSASVGVAGVNISLIVDRFGNQYVTLPDLSGDVLSLVRRIVKQLGSKGLSIPGGATYSEGYVCADGNYDRCRSRTSPLPSETLVRDGFIIGPCTGGGAVVAVGGKLVVCQSGSRGIIYSWGPMIGIGIQGSVGRHFGTNMNQGWNWAVQDRFNGTSYVDLMVKAKSTY